MLVLGIESTCDETACSIVKDGVEILSNVISSQIDLHSEYGGVVPELACRRHVDVLIPVIQEALATAHIHLDAIDLVAVAHGPGLVGALLIGLTSAKALAFSLDKPLIGINHVEAHLYAALMSHPEPVVFPCLGVVLSGGHTTLLLMKNIGEYQLIGETIDDAIGEAFDKVAKTLDLPYPGGPYIEQLALQGNPTRYAFKPGKVKDSPYSFSFSGLKTAVLYAVKGQFPNRELHPSLSHSDKCDIAASFQEAAFNAVIKKALLAAEQYQCQTLVFGGGVTNNQCLRKRFAKMTNRTLLWPSIGLSLDNAAMIAGLGYHRFLKQGVSDGWDLEAMTRINF